MSSGARARRWRRVLCALIVVGCDPLDIQLFPVRVDAGGPPAGEDADGQDAGEVAPADPPAEAGGPALCLPGAARCEACVASAACPADQRCHPFTGLCVSPCGPELPACDGSLLCNEDLGVCVSCVDDSACDDDDGGDDDDRRICDELQGICVECMNDDHCTDDPSERPVCLTGLGVCGCERDDDCATGICELPDAQCEEEDDD